jgi:hypothetical protein
VLDDEKLVARNTLRDINMMVIGGKERSMRQWEELLQTEDFVVEKYYGLDGRMNSIIEARLKK